MDGENEFEEIIRILKQESGNNINDEEYRENQKERYMTMKLEDLKKIKPLWATDELMHHNIGNPPGDLDNLEHISINTIQLIEAVNFQELNPKNLFSTKQSSNMSFVTTLIRWENGQPVDPPTLCYNKEKEYLEFTDGRHRAILAHHLGQACIPVAIHRYSKQFLIERVKLCPS
ncbi:hypothetical protein [Cyclobacterium jeungdonense]|uniref:ParB/Sulfiredoxin domain-containing protein n=1 Tax=Cyclobacterium jeungdonense TaxID=708087 RepID=A0ABT8CA42_9BACT|nr:hypothetical protein [Cyclobacterium jeungdonense]MDN3689663.1 hypothetical protein [Cyclobacterium jeungdonense]